MRQVLAYLDTIELRGSLAERLAADEIRLVAASLDRSFVEQIRELLPDAVLLAHSGDAADAARACAEVRRETGAGLLVLTLVYDQAQAVEALDAGADDYFVLRGNDEELAARIRALLRRSARMSGQRTYSLGDLRLDVEKRTVRVRDRVVALTPLEFRLVQCLAANTGKSLSPGTLLRAVQGYDLGEQEATQIIKALVWRVRKKIEDDPSNPQYIRNVRGSGYTLERRPAQPRENGPPLSNAS